MFDLLFPSSYIPLSLSLSRVRFVTAALLEKVPGLLCKKGTTEDEKSFGQSMRSVQATKDQSCTEKEIKEAGAGIKGSFKLVQALHHLRANLGIVREYNGTEEATTLKSLNNHT